MACSKIIISSTPQLGAINLDGGLFFHKNALQTHRIAGYHKALSRGSHAVGV